MGKMMSINLSHATRELVAPDWFSSAHDLSLIWPDLVSGRARIVRSGATDTHHYFQLSAVPSQPQPTKLTALRLALLERVLLGEAQKVVAMDAGCSTSTVSTAVGVCLRAMGLHGGSSRVPPLLVLVLHALHGKAHCAELLVERLPGPEGELRVVSSSRLDLALEGKLSACEMAVARLLIEGNSHAEIARQRRTSARTVANQIASVYRKLGVSGRIELLCYLVSELRAAAERQVVSDLPAGLAN
jgi:DNA-binding NarL/FixJ family response regulator